MAWRRHAAHRENILRSLRRWKPVSREPAPAKLVIHGDCQVVIGDVLRDEAIGSHVLSTYAARARGLIAQFADVHLQRIPRVRNTADDALSQ